MTQTKSRDAVEHAIGQIDLWNSATKAMLLPMPDLAHQQASEQDRSRFRRERPQLLDGMTVSIKDNIDLEGVPTTAGTRILADNIAARDAFVVSRLRQHGALIVGKANLHEWVFGPTSQSLHYGPVRNPWKLDAIPGGSSGGSGAAVAADMCVGSIGSDTAGSIRIPASLNGVAGLRPTIGRISNTGAIPVSAAFDTLGPLARRVSDLARIFEAIAGYDEQDPISVDVPVENIMDDLDQPVAGMRIGIMRRWLFDDLHPDLAEALEESLEIYRRLGVEIVEIDLGDAHLAQDHQAFRIVMADAYSIHQDRLTERRLEYGDDVHGRLMIGAGVSGAQYAESLRWIERWRHRLRQLFRTVDAIFAPTTPVPAISAGEDFFSAIRLVPRFACMWPAGGNPSLAVPCGFSKDGLPLSFQLASRWFDEKSILRLGHAYQMVSDHHLQRPRL